MEAALRTWEFFEEFANEENNYLAPDNYQESRPEQVTPRTSSTNIALGLLSIMSAYDLGFIRVEEAVERIEKCVRNHKQTTKMEWSLI